MLLKNIHIHNVEGETLDIPEGQLVVFTGVSGSGKSSLAFHAVHAASQKAYLQALSPHMQRHLTLLSSAEMDCVTGLCPSIAIDQKSGGKNPRSTVGTLTGIYDYLRILFARASTAYCPISGESLSPRSPTQIVEQIQELFPQQRLFVFAPFAKNKKGEFKEEFRQLIHEGFTRLRINGKWVNLEEQEELNKKVAHTIEILIDRVLSQEKTRLQEAVELALKKGGGTLLVSSGEEKEPLLF